MRKGIELRIQKLEDNPFKFDDYNQRLHDAFQEQAQSGNYIYSLKRMGKPKTTKQTKMIFGHMIASTIQQADELSIGVADLLLYLIDDHIPKGVEINKDFLHELMYTICPTTDENGKRITLSKMDTEQANNLFERYRNLLAPLGIVIQDPNKDWKSKL